MEPESSKTSPNRHPGASHATQHRGATPSGTTAATTAAASRPPASCAADPALQRCHVFLSHAGEEKAGLVAAIRQHLASAAAAHPLQLFESDWSLQTGGPPRDEVLRACWTSNVAVIILSPSFVHKPCPMEELRILVQRHHRGELHLLLPLCGLQERDLSNVKKLHDRGGSWMATALLRRQPDSLGAWTDALRQLVALRGKEVFELGDQWALDTRRQAGRIAERVLHLQLAAVQPWQRLESTPPVSLKLNLVPSPGVDLLGRIEELQRAMQALTGPHRCVLLHGLGGMGKTTLARQLVARLCCRWPVCETDTGTAGVGYAFEVDLPGMSQSDNFKELLAIKLMHPVHNVEGVEHWQSWCSWVRSQQPSKVLLLLDDVQQNENVEAFKETLMALNSMPNVHIIMTTRSPSLHLPFLEQAHGNSVVQLGPLSTDAGVQLLEQQLGSSLKMWSFGESLESVRQLVELVGGCPLVLSIAAGLVKTRGTQWKELLQHAQLGAGTSSHNDPSDHTPSSTAVLQGWLAHSLTEPEQRLLANLAALGGSLTARMATALQQDMDACEVSKMLEVLQGMHLLGQHNVLGFGNQFPELQQGSRLMIHSMVREAAWQLHGLTTGGNVTASMVLALLQPIEEAENKLGLPWCSSSQDVAVEMLLAITGKEACGFAAALAVARGHCMQDSWGLCDWEALPGQKQHQDVQLQLKCQLQEEVLASRSALLGVEHPDVLHSIDMLLATLHEVGQLDARVCKLQELVVTIRCRTLGHVHAETLVSKSRLARVMCVVGQLDTARQLQEEVLAYREEVMGPEHADTLASKAELAATLQQAGDLAGARELQTAVVDAHVRLLGPQQQETVGSKSRLASILSDAGELQVAKQLEEEVLQVRLQTLGLDHPDTLASKNNLAVIYWDLGELPAARRLQEEVLADCHRVLGPEHTSTLSSRTNLANTLVSLGELSTARKLQEEALEASIKLLGPNHNSTLACKSNLSSTLCTMGCFDEAKKLQEEVVEAWTCVLGGDHPDMLTSKNNLASIMKEQGELRAAKRLQEQVLAGFARALGADHPVTLTSKNNLADTLRELGQLQQAKQLDEEVLKCRTRVLGPAHPDTLSSKNNLASTLHSLGQLKEACKLLAEVLDELTAALGPCHPSSLACKSNLASTLTSMKNMSKAKVLQEEVSAAYTSLLGPEHPDTLASKHNLSLTLSRLGMLREAKHLQQEALAGRMKVLGPQHPDTLDTRSVLAATLKKG